MAIYFDQNGNLVDTEGDINFFNTSEEKVFPTQDTTTYMPETNTPFYQPNFNSMSLQPQLQANRLEGLPTLDLQSLPANMGVANEADVEQVDSLTGEKTSSGIMDLIMSLAIPGYSVLKNIGSKFKPDPRAIGIRNFYSPEGLTSSGSIASGIMKGYNPVSGGLFGQPANFGLAGAMQKRIENILGRKAPQTDASRDRVNELQGLQLAEMRDRVNRGESLGSIGQSTFSGPGMAFEKQSGGVSGKGTADERNYGGR